MADSVTGEHSPDNVCMQTVSRGRSKCPWCGLKIEHLSKILGFFVVIALKVRRAILKVVFAVTGSQSILAKTGVM